MKTKGNYWDVKTDKEKEEKELFEKVFFGFDVVIVLKEAEKIEALPERLLFLKNIVKKYGQSFFGLDEEKIKRDYLVPIELEIGFIEDSIKYLPQVSHYNPSTEITNKTLEKEVQCVKRGIISYQWKGDINKEVSELYNKMKGVFINEKTLESDFIAVFSGVVVTGISNKIEWISSKNLLAYFVDKLRIENKVSLETDIWSIAKECFSDASNLKQAKGNYSSLNKTGMPQNHNSIDQLFKT